MSPYFRHAVSRAMGAVEIRVFPLSSIPSVVTVSPTGMNSPVLTFIVDGGSDTLAAILPWVEPREEVVARIALAQAQAQAQAQSPAVVDGLMINLDLSFRPWIGDLLLTPFGGVTDGITTSNLSILEQRQQGNAWRTTQSLILEYATFVAQNCATYNNPRK